MILNMFNIFNKNKKEYSPKDEYSKYLDSIKNNHTKNYIEQRVLGQINWYDGKSIHFQNQFKIFTTISLILSASIPVLSLINSKKYFIFRILISIASSAVTVITGTLSLFKSKELWLQYRNSCESLKSLLHQYFTNSDIFSDKDDPSKDKLLIEKCECIITYEVSNWANMNIKKNSNCT